MKRLVPAFDLQAIVALIHGKQQRLTGLHNALLIYFSLIYGFILQSLPVLGFLDRQNYLTYASDSVNILVHLAIDGPIVTLANEPLWLLINIGLAQFFDPEIVVRIIIFFGAFLLSYSLTSANPKHSIWLALFLLMPQLLKNNITHLRQGLAMAFFFAGFFSKGLLKRWILMVSTPFIHASFFYILPFVMLPAISNRLRLGMDIRLVILGGFAVLASLSLSILVTLVGARQAADYDFTMASVSGLGFAFWAIIATFFFVQGKTFLKNNQEAVGILLLYLVSYFFIEITARVFESGMPLVLLAGLTLPRWQRWAFIVSFLLYSSMQWILRLSSAAPF